MLRFAQIAREDLVDSNCAGCDKPIAIEYPDPKSNSGFLYTVTGPKLRYHIDCEPKDAVIRWS